MNPPQPDITRIIQEMDKILFDCIVAVGVREEGTIRDLDTLIIDRQEAVQKLVTLIQEARQVVINEVLSGLPTHEKDLDFTYFIEDKERGWTQDQLNERRWGYNLALNHVKQQLEGLLGKENL